MTQTDRHPAGTVLTVDQVASIARVDTAEVMNAIRSKKLRAEQRRGQWEIQVQDMRVWLSRL